ncbi:MAG: tRNA (adenosine(37)-N6)-threonylcarbamoyltransferase complex ATPase subunit type 1 TsaE [Casimicrobiaceae bacterium]
MTSASTVSTMTTMQAQRKYLPDASATMGAGARLAPGLAGGMVVTLSGELGAGKTTLARGLLHGLGWTGPVKSPSYTLVEHYPLSSLYFYHFDFYRFDKPGEWEDSGFAEYFRPDAICVIEWPERVRGMLAQPDLALALAYQGDGRMLSLDAATPAGKACLAAFAPPAP